jgi:hypothetical protein
MESRVCRKDLYEHPRMLVIKASMPMLIGQQRPSGGEQISERKMAR